ncbi:MAG: hypothetical protein AB7F78_18255 [Hyphomicrobiaceae bacterium]
MDSQLIADRHPVLGRLFRIWLAGRDGAAMPRAEAIIQCLADLEDVVVVVFRPIGSEVAPKIERSGKTVDRLYGIALAGESIGRLTPSSTDAENEAVVVLETGRTLMMEDQVQLPGGPTRIARLYLPFTDAADQVGGIIVGITKAS